MRLMVSSGQSLESTSEYEAYKAELKKRVARGRARRG
jgi:hypothetical protein